MTTEHFENWTDLHPDFAKRRWDEKTWQQLWEKIDCTYQEAQEWISLGFIPDDYNEIKGWKEIGISPTEAQEWRRAGFKEREYGLINYFRTKNYTPETAFQNKDQAQHWLDCCYPNEGVCLLGGKRELGDFVADIVTFEGLLPNNYGKTREQITHLDINEKQLTGVLDLSDFINLEELCCYKNQLTQLTLPATNKLATIDITHLSSFNCSVLNPSTLTYLDLSNNNLEPTDISVFSPLVNLSHLDISNTNEWIQAGNQGNQFYGSLESLKNLTKLEVLEISNTNINTGLEYLPDNLQRFNYDSLPNFNFQVQEIEKELEWYDKEYDKEGFYYPPLYKIRNKLELLSKNKKLYKYIRSQYPNLESFQEELNKHKKLFANNNEFSDLFRRWKRELLVKNPNFLKISELNSQISDKEAKIKSLEQQLQNNSLSQIDIEKLLNEKNQLEKEFHKLQAQMHEILTQENTRLLEAKKEELEQLKKKRNESQKYIINLLLKSVEHLVSYDISATGLLHREQKENHINYLLSQGMKQAEIDKLCETQKEITLLKLKLEELAPKKQLLLADNQKEQLLLEFTEHPIFTQELLKQTNLYLQSKENFISLRKETITLLQEVVDLLEKETILNKGKYVQREEGAKLLTATLKITPIAEGMLGTNELVGEAVSVTFNHFKRRFNEQNSQIFKQHLEKSDNTDELTKQRDFLLEIVNKNPHFNSSQTISELFKLDDKDRIFEGEYQIYRVATNIWKHKGIITVEDMKGAIDKLTENLQSLERELKQEKNEIKKLNSEVIDLEQKLLTCSIEQK